MILKNSRIYNDGIIQNGAILVQNGIIKRLFFNTNTENIKELKGQNQDMVEIDCENKLILPGIIDIHSHLRDLEQSEKETFNSATKAAAYSGITTVFNMPNTIPPSNTAVNVKRWMERAKNNIYVDVGFIAGVPKDIDEVEIKKIINLGVIGFKIYPLEKTNGIDWTKEINIQKLLKLSSKYHKCIFIHPDYPISDDLKLKLQKELLNQKYTDLEFHNKMYPNEMEAKYVHLIVDNYKEVIDKDNLQSSNYPIVHFCHISCKESYLLIKKTLEINNEYKMTFEVTPHHLLLSNKIKLENHNYGKVLPPLRNKEHPLFLYTELKNGNIDLIGTDHAPHTLYEKSKDFNSAPNGFPGFETYPLVIMNKICSFELSIERFVKIASETPAKIFHLNNKGFIKEGYDADLIVIDKVSDYLIDPLKFKTKAKFSPFEKSQTNIQIWKVFLRGKEINIESSEVHGKILKF